MWCMCGCAYWVREVGVWSDFSINKKDLGMNQGREKKGGMGE